MKKYILVLRIVFFTITLFLLSCTTDDALPLDENGEIIPEQGNQIVSGDPSLNNFLITSNDETLFTVDPETGDETEIFTFPDLVDLELLAEYNNGVAYVTSDNNAVNAINIANKNFLWDTPMLEYRFSSDGLSPTVCIDGVCYASGGFGVVVALDEATGALKWHYSSDPDGDLDGLLNENRTPVVHGDKVYIFSDEGFTSDLEPFMHVLDKETGELLQKVILPYEASATPLIQNNILYLPAKNLYVVDLDTLDIIWRLDANGVGAPAISGNRIVVHGIIADQTTFSETYCLALDTGEIIWQKDSGFDRVYSPIIVENVVFGIFEEASASAFSNNGSPFAARLSDGEELWFNDRLSIDHSPVYANGRLFFHGHDVLRSNDTDQDVGLLTVDANTGEVLWVNNTFRFGSSLVPLVVADNGVFGPSYYRGN